MATATARKTAKKTPTKKTAASTARVRAGDTDAVRDAVSRVVEQAKSEQAERGHYRVAALNDVQDFASGLSDQFLECRDGGHKWKFADYAKEGRGFSRRKYCPTCKHQIWQTFDSRGMLVAEKPEYPEGYLAKGMGRVNRDGKGMMRVESFHRAIEKQEARTAAKKTPAKKATSRK